MSTQIKLPSLGENIDAGDVLSILVSEGDVVTKDQDLIEVETDKATVPVPSPQAGKIVKLLVSEGDTIEVGKAFAEIEAGDADEGGSPSPQAEEEASAPAKEEPKPKPKAQAAQPDEEPEKEKAQAAEQPHSEITRGAPSPDVGSPSSEKRELPHVSARATVASAPSTDANGSRPVEDVPGDGHASAAAGPSVRRLARELGVDLRRVRPSGEGGRITEADVRNHVRTAQQESAARAPKGVTPPGAPDTDGHGAVRRERMSRMRQTIARNMLLSYTTIPQLTNFDEVDISELDKLRKESAGDYAAQGFKLTTMPFLVKAVAVALKHHPIVNASVSESGDEIIYKEYVNLGIAVDTPKGLIVPVLRDADRKSIPQVTREIVELATAARDGTFGIDDLRGGTFTISNLGAVGGIYSTPIINPPEAAILLVGRARMMPQFIDGAFQPRLMMPLSITYDHRIVDGAAAARFLNDVKGYLANPGRLLLAPT